MNPFTVVKNDTTPTPLDLAKAEERAELDRWFAALETAQDLGNRVRAHVFTPPGVRDLARQVNQTVVHASLTASDILRKVQP